MNRVVLRSGTALLSSAALSVGVLAGAVASAPAAAAAAFDCLSTVSPTTGVTTTMVGSDCVISIKGTGTSYAWTKPAFVTSIAYLVVGGGGAGALGNGDTHGGGGGGGGGVATATVSIAGDLTVTVGAGGASYGLGGQGSSLRGALRVDAYGGGGGTTSRGGSSYAVNSTSTQYSGGLAYSGSTASCNANPYPECSGGGGAGTTGNGGAGTITVTSNNGSGYQSDISGSTQTYGAGGRGGAAQNVSYNGDDYEGEGGSGHSDRASFNYGSKGGSGIVILRFSTKESSLSTEPPSSAVVDQILTQSPVVTLAEGGVAASGVSVTAALGTQPTPSGNQITPVLDGTTTVTTDGSGVATFSDLSIRGPTGNYTLTFTASGYTTLTSITIGLTVGDPSQLSLVTASPTSLQVANPGNTSTVTVQALDAGGNTISTGGATVALSATAGSVGTVNDAGDGTYTATYTGTSSIADSPVTISGTINAIAITDTAAITLTPGAPSALSITTQPSAGASASGIALATQPVVEVVDEFGNLVTAATGTVTAAITSGSGSLSSNTATISGGVATFSGLTVTGAASESYELTFSSGALTAAVSSAFSLAKAAQTISFGAAPTPTWSNGGTFSVSATASPSGLAVAYSIDSSSSSVCSIANSAVGTVTMLTAGSCVVNANQAGDADYAAATQVQQTVTIAKASQTVSFTYTGGTKTFGDADFSVASMASASSGLSPTFTSSDTSVCTVTTGGTVTLVAHGTCTLVADQPGDARYSAASSTVGQSFTVNRGTTTITWSPTTALTMPESGATFAAASSLAGAVTYAVTDQGTTGCVVNSGARTITFSGTGSCTVSATAAQNDQYDSVSTSQTFVITKADQTVTINDPGAQTYSSSGTFAITGSATSSLTVSFGSTTPAVCTVSGTTVTIVASGTCTITGDQAGNGSYNAAPQATRDVTINKAATTVTWAPTTAATTLQSPLTPSSLATVSTGGGAITYAVADAGTTGCAVDPTSAVLTYSTSGSCQVTATSAATANYAAGSTTVTFVITKVAQSINFGSLTNQAYGSGPYVISGSTDATGLVLSYSTTTPTVCSVTGSSSLVGSATTASVSLLATGTCTIVAAQPGDDTYSAASSATQSFTITQGTQAALSFSNSSTVVFDGSLTLQTVGGSGTGAVSYAVTAAGTAGCSVGLTSGVLSFTSAGTCDVQATKLGGGVFADTSTSITTITVSKAPQSTSITSTVPSAPLPGDTYPVTSTATSGLTTNLSILAGSGTVCSISGSGPSETVTFLATGTCIIYASQFGNGNYLPADPEDSQTIEVGAINQSITFGALADKDFGSASFAVSATASSGLTVTFASTTSSVCTATTAGVVTLLAVGECRITASQAGNAQYGAASDVVRVFEVVAVVPFAPTIMSGSGGDGAITIAYTAPSFDGGTSISGYQAVATPTAGPAVTVPCSDLTAPLVCTLAGLTNGTAYTVTVAAVSSAGVGAASGATGAITPAAAAMAVTSAYAVPGDGTVDLSFDAITTGGLGGGTFTRYEIYRRVSTGAWPGSPTTTIATQGSGVLSQSYSGLANGTSYEFKIVVITSANAAEITGNTTFVAEYPSTVPTAPVDLTVVATSGTAALVSWSVPLSDGGAAITSYAVGVTGGLDCQPVSIDASTLVASCPVTGMAYSTTYTVTVSAVNRMGDGATSTATHRTGADPNPGGGGGGTGGGGATDPADDSGESTAGGDSGGPRVPPVAGGPALPPRFPTPDGPSDEERRKLDELPTSRDVRGLPPSTPVPGVPPTPAPAWTPPTGSPTGRSDGSVGGGAGFRVYDPSSAEVQEFIASGTPFTLLQSAGTQGYSTTWRYSVTPNTMLQVVVPMEPATGTVPFALWLQDRKGTWTSLGTTSLVDGQLVMPVLFFDLPGVYQVVATSMDAANRTAARGSEPQWGKTTVRTIVTVKADDALGTALCPNAVGFTAESARLDRRDKRELRRLSVCLGATPRVTVTGHVHGYTKPKVARELARDRALAVKKFLRSVGFTGRVVVSQSIVQRPAACKPHDNRCAVVEIRLGSLRNSVQSAAPPAAQSVTDDLSAESTSPDLGAPADAGPAVAEVDPAPDEGSAESAALSAASPGPPPAGAESGPTEGAT